MSAVIELFYATLLRQDALISSDSIGPVADKTAVVGFHCACALISTYVYCVCVCVCVCVCACVCVCVCVCVVCVRMCVCMCVHAHLSELLF